MEVSNLVIVIVFIIAAVGFNFWKRRYIKSKTQEPGKLEQFSKKSTQIGAIISTIVAGILIAVIWSQLENVPPENRIFVLFFIVFGVLWALYSWYRFYKARRTR